MVGAQLAMAARTDTTGVLGGIHVPTLVVVGEEDALIPPDVSREMAARIPGARLEVLPGAGHLAPLEVPDAFNRALGGFLEPALLGL
jgi:3-oxoadipate enol-lactonase